MRTYPHASAGHDIGSSGDAQADSTLVPFFGANKRVGALEYGERRFQILPWDRRDISLREGQRLDGGSGHAFPLSARRAER